MADEPDAVLVAVIVDDTIAIEEEEEPLLSPYCARAGTARAEKRRVDAMNFCILAILYVFVSKILEDYTLVGWLVWFGEGCLSKFSGSFQALYLWTRIWGGL